MLEFVVRQVPNRPDAMEARYDCACGCKPRARYQRGAQEAGYEHCCCGQVHFLGEGARAQLEAYLSRRRAEGLDADMRYTLHATTVSAPWGGTVPAAYAVPDKPRPH